MNSAEKSEDLKPSNPAEQLASLLDEDMRAVNALILERMDSPVKLIPQLASYLIAAGGKRIRPLLTLSATQICNGDMKRAHMLAACVEFIHTATLLHDDVVDESKERRGQEAANLVFGNQASVLVGDFLFSRAFQLMTEDGSLEILRILSEASATIAQGEVMQLTTANNLETTMDDYIEVITAKTAALFSAACEVGPVIAGSDKKTQEAFAAYGLNMGIAFQIADDALDYMAQQETLGKNIGDDFREGKMTAPILFALEKATDDEKDFWQRTLGKRDQKAKDLKTAQNLIKKHNSDSQALKLAENYAQKACEALQDIAENPLNNILYDLSKYSVHRAY